MTVIRRTAMIMATGIKIIMIINTSQKMIGFSRFLSQTSVGEKDFLYLIDIKSIDYYYYYFVYPQIFCMP